MSMIEEPPDAEVVDLEPTLERQLDSSTGGAGAPAVNVAMAVGTMASLAGETGTLRRSRLSATALLLTVVYAVLFAWNLSSWAKDLPTVWVVMGARFVLSGVILGLLLSPFAATPGRLRILEVALFGGLTALLVSSQYMVNLELMRRGDIPGLVAFVKNGIIQMIVLMIIFGAFIPNPPKVVAWSVLAMALAPLLGFTLLTEHPEIASAVVRFRSVEQTGSNGLFVLIGAGIAVYASLILNGLRTELHEAKKFGRYTLLRKIGAGGMGEVYLAEHSLLKRPCALKLIKSDAVTDPVSLARFEREVRSSARLAHYNTIEIYDYGHTDDGTFYYVMQYLEGMTLAELVAEHGPLSPGRVIYLFRQVCAGLAEAHDLGLVHRDLKPANIFVAVLGGETDVAKVLDFGLVKAAAEPGEAALTAETTVSGTPLYMAPEQAMGERDLDARADIYALGAVMYFALTGEAPFQGGGAFAVMMAHVKDPVVPPSNLRPDLPGDLERVVLRCLSKKAKDRYPTVRALREALGACASASEWGPNRADAWWSSVGTARGASGEGQAPSA